jgi:Xaa-Pro aminopeptidase
VLTVEGCRTRRRRLWERLDPPPDWIIISDPLHLMYLANYFPSPFEFRSSDAAAILLLGRDDSSVLLADNLLQPFCDQAFVDEIVAPVWYRGTASPCNRREFLIQNALARLSDCGGDRFGYEPGTAPAGLIEGLRASRPELQWTNVEPILVAMRRKKELDEIALLKRSMAAGEAGMAAGLREIRPGMSEQEAYRVVQRAALAALGEPAIVYGDFVSGRRCEQVGGPPTNRKIAAGDLVLLDFSTVVRHYRADFANTFVCGGRPSTKVRELHQACLEALRAGETQLRPGTPAREVYAAVRGAFTARGLAENFPGHAGHGVGLGHPEAPFIVPQSLDILEPGNVVTLEPGQYIPGVAGLRLERNYLITDTGYDVLSRHELRLEP